MRSVGGVVGGVGVVNDVAFARAVLDPGAGVCVGGVV